MSDRQPKQILIIDDDEDQLAIRELLLQARGFRTLAAQDVRSALSLAKAERPDCALLDLHLPTEAAGVALLHSLQALPDPPRVVILTGSNAERIERTPGMEGVDAIVEKGSPSTMLIDVLNRVCVRTT